MNYAIVLSVENKVNRDVFDANKSSPYEKEALGLIHSIRQHSDVDVYCGNFTNHKLSAFARLLMHKHRVKVVDHVPYAFSTNGVAEFMFLRTFTKHWFGSTLLDQYDYLIYLDVDVVMLRNPTFDFDPAGPITIKCTMPQWVCEYHKQHLDLLRGPLCYNWVDIINKHNLSLFDMDWDDPMVLNQHTADVIVSNRIASTNLTTIEQRFGGYNCITELTPESIFHHYDSLGSEGSMYMLEQYHQPQLEDMMKYFERTLGLVIRNDRDYWNEIVRKYQ